MHHLRGEQVLRQQRKFPGIAGSTIAGDDAGQGAAAVVVETAIEHVDLDAQAEGQMQFRRRADDVPIRVGVEREVLAPGGIEKVVEGHPRLHTVGKQLRPG